ncbi:MAG TPA: hypothetical protein VKY19_17840 [Ktedonosporobacter sp.]|jgi:hypothetical protein|nr:hypothetical protein [Ktedonosporobacter sp.]
MRKIVAAMPVASRPLDNQQVTQSKSTKAPMLFTCAFILCILISIAPLVRLAGVAFYQLPTNFFLTLFGAWLPIDFGLAADPRASQISTHALLFLACMAIAFIIYGLFAWFIQRQSTPGTSKSTLRWIWAGAAICGIIFILTPAMLSHDIFVYTSYGRIITIYHANPYFVPLIRFPHDYFLPYDDWKKAIAAYGPLWLTLSAVFTPIIGDNTDRALLIYRIFAFAIHLVNTLLIIRLLRTMERSERTIVLGTLLYAWNPLLLEESSLGGHNDEFMVTFFLLGLLFSIRYELRKTGGLRSYLPSLFAFTLAALIKFTALPLVVLSLVMLVRKRLYPAAELPQQRKLEWKSALLTALLAGLTSITLVLVMYAPYWIGHSIGDIITSFTAPPSATMSYGSIHRAIIRVVQVYGLPPVNNWTYLPLQIFSSHDTWDRINLVALALLMIVSIIWLWRAPTTRTLAVASLATLGTLLVVTPWFFPWYLAWVLSLAVVCLPVTYDRVARALIAATFTFSATSLIIYLYHQKKAPFGEWIGLDFLTTLGPPIVVLLIFLFLPIATNDHSLEATPTSAAAEG